MNKIITLILLLIVSTISTSNGSENFFDEGLKLYKNKKYDDTFAIGDYESMMYYAFLFNHYIPLVSDCNTFHSESILFNYLNRNNKVCT